MTGSLRLCALGLLLLAGLLALPDVAHASVGSGGGLPYEDWFTQLRSSVTGPFAFTAALIGLAVAGGTLIFGGDLNGFFRTMIYLTLVMALLVTAQNVMSTYFGRGAVAVLSDTIKTTA